MEKTKKRPSLQYAIAALVTLVIFVVICLLVFEIPIIITLFFSWIILTPFAVKLGYSIADVEDIVYDMIKSAASMFALLLSIGCMVAIWLCAGDCSDVDRLGPAPGYA